MLHKTSTPIVTDASGDATVYLGAKILGFVQAIKYLPGTLDTGADLTITGETSGIPILTKANAGTSNVFYFPRALPNAVGDGAAESDSSELIPIVHERLKVVVAQGGNAKSGSIELIFDSGF